VLQRRGTAALVGRAPTLLIRFWDKHWARYQQQLLEGRARRRELQMQRRMQALGLHESAA
jgi:ABC-type Fe2+-enterobactin transport system substrate-binding protein